MSFIELKGGEWVNTNRVVRIVHSLKGNPLVYGAEGESLGRLADERLDPNLIDTPCIPCGPNWNVITVFDGFDPGEPLTDKYFLTPIVGWRVCGETTVPITIETICGDQRAILTPDGQVFKPEDCTYESVAKFIEHYERELKKSKE